MSSSKSITVAVVSDTHGNLPTKLLTLIKNVDFIIHAGDFTSESIMKQLEKIAPVFAVRGNCDRGVLGTLPLTLFFKREGISIALVHRFYDLNLSSLPDQPRIVICGHTHVPFNSEVNGILYVNPGSPVSPRGGSEPSFCQLKLKNGNIKATIITL